MFKQIDTKYAMIILAVVIVLCVIIGLVVLNMAADKHKYIQSSEFERDIKAFFV